MKKFPSNFVKRKIHLLCFDTNSTFDRFYVKKTVFSLNVSDFTLWC